MNQYQKALLSSEAHNALLNKAVKDKKTRRGFANAIYRVWCRMCEEAGMDPDIEVFCKRGHDCANDTYHVAWESMPYNVRHFYPANKYMYGEHYWSFSVVIY
tara:strand:+ start:258 stop:563 length:306 start_codon:yes stop_codon:yes gene_type:complete